MIEIAYSDAAVADLRQLKCWRPSYAREVMRIIREELRVDGYVADVYAPHVLDNPNGYGSGYVEFHAFDDVLVLYYPPNPKGFVRIHHVCTHDALHTGNFENMWPCP